MPEAKQLLLTFTGENHVKVTDDNRNKPDACLVEIPCFIEAGSSSWTSEIGRFVDASNCFSQEDEVFRFYKENFISTSDVLNARKVFEEIDRYYLKPEYGTPEHISDLEMLLRIYHVIFVPGEKENSAFYYILAEQVGDPPVDSPLRQLSALWYSLVHYAISHGYSCGVCEHCKKPFFRKNKHTKYCTRISPLFAHVLTDCAALQCEEAVKTATGKLSNKYKSLMKPYQVKTYDLSITEKEKSEKSNLQDLRDRFIKQDKVNLIERDYKSLEAFWANLIRFENSKNRCEFMEKEFLEEV